MRLAYAHQRATPTTIAAYQPAVPTHARTDCPYDRGHGVHPHHLPGPYFQWIVSRGITGVLPRDRQLAGPEGAA